MIMLNSQGIVSWVMLARSVFTPQHFHITTELEQQYVFSSSSI